MTDRLRVYIAGPISLGPIEANVKAGTDALVRLLKAGFAPFCPQLTCYAGGPVPQATPCDTKHEDWLGADLPWVAVSDAVLRLPGESRGADMETALAGALGIPVYETIEALQEKPPVRGDERFQALLRELGQLHARKQRDYGRKGDPFANLRASSEWGIPPWLGALLRANDKVSRLKTYALTRSLACEGVEDSLKDLAVYALIALVLHRENT